MKYLSQILIILLLSALGELLNHLIPLPIPAAIYGLVLLAAALFSGLLKLEQVKKAGTTLVSLLPVLFVAPIVSLLDSWELLRENLLVIGLLVILSTVLCFVVTGLVTQALMGREEPND